MAELLSSILSTFLSTVRDIAPIGLLLVFFQLFVLKEKIAQLKRILVGFFYVIAGLALFLIGLDQALFPIGEIMATQLTDPSFITETQSITESASKDVSNVNEIDNSTTQEILWWQYHWVYIFAFAIGFSTTIAEPSLIAVAMKANEASGGALSPWGLRIAVALGVAISIALGAFRIVTGTSLAYYMMVGYLLVIIQTIFAPKMIVPLAYDSGGVTTSTVTVPLVTALGLGLASTVPGRSPLIDGFGLIALASLFPMITVMAYAQLSRFKGTEYNNE